MKWNSAHSQMIKLINYLRLATSPGAIIPFPSNYIIDAIDLISVHG